MGPNPHSSMTPQHPSRGVLIAFLLSISLPVVAHSSTDGAWSVTPGASAPFQRSRHAMIYDSVNQQALVFGGLQGSERKNDLWALPLGSAPVWMHLTFNGTPPSPRSDVAAIYDPVRHRMVVFGGTDGALLQNEVWALSLDSPRTWTLLAPTGTPPTPRRGAAAIYDAALDRMIVVGGFDGSTAGNDVWALSLGADPAWTSLAPTGTAPGGREGAAADYDPSLGRLVMFGGYNAVTSTYIGDTWSLTLGASPAWKRLLLGNAPGPRAWSSSVHDAVNNRMVLVGGFDGQRSYSDTYVMQSSVWAAWGPGPAAMARRHAHGAVYDSQRRRMVVFGGSVDAGYPLSDAWALGFQSPTAWTAITPSNQPIFPTPRREFGAILANDAVVVFGGEVAGAFANDAYMLPLGGDGSWAPLVDSGLRPAGRNSPNAIYDPLSNRLLIIGGSNGNSNRLTDVWDYSFGSHAWQQRVASSSSLERIAGAVYDPVRGRAILLDAGTSASVYTMAMRLDNYAISVIGNPQPSNTIPGARVSFSVIYQPRLDRIVMYGGFDIWHGGALGEVWFLSLSGPAIWTQASVGGPPPSARWGHTAVYDETRDRMIMIGGYDGTAALNDVWALSLGPTIAWTRLSPLGMLPHPRDAAGALYDATRQRVVMFGGYDPGDQSFLNDVGFLAFGGNVSVEPPQEARLSLAGARPNPAVGPFSVRFSLEDASPARIELFDLAGRLTFAREVGMLGPGEHDVRIEGARTIPDGLYFVRLRQHARALTSRVLVAR